MVFMCPKCQRPGMVWDGRAKVIMCYFYNCHHTIERDLIDGKRRWDTPTDKEIQSMIDVENE